MNFYPGPKEDPLIGIENLAVERLQAAGLMLSSLACENILSAQQFGLFDYSPEVLRGILAASIEANRESRVLEYAS